MNFGIVFATASFSVTQLRTVNCMFSLILCSVFMSLIFKVCNWRHFIIMLVFIEKILIAATYVIIPSDTKLVPSDQEFVPSHQELIPSHQELSPADPEFVPSHPEFVPS